MTLYHLPFITSDAVSQMAIDRDMFERDDLKESAILRFYGWTQPAVTFGYSQKWNEVILQLNNPNQPIIRRMTGGGIVNHGNDLTYCLKLPPKHPITAQPASGIYQSLHSQIATALTSINIQTILAPCTRGCTENSTPNSLNAICFKQPEAFDLIDPNTNQKIAGAALKRNRHGLLIQGSIQFSNTTFPETQNTINAITASFIDWIYPNQKSPIHSISPTPSVEIFKKQFQSTNWNQKR